MNCLGDNTTPTPAESAATAHLLRLFAVAQATTPGREHRRLERNNQDAATIRCCPPLLVLAVADGCSAGARSEVGAELSVRWLASGVPNLYIEHSRRLDAELAEAVCDGLLAFLGELLRGLGGADDPSARSTLGDLLLTTLIVAVVDAQRALVFGVGDGVVLVNGRRVSPRAGRVEAPAYLAYSLLSTSPSATTARTQVPTPGSEPELAVPSAAVPQIFWQGPTATLDTLVLGTDGLDDLLVALPDAHEDEAGTTLDGLLTEPRYVRNPSLVQKHLRVLGNRPGLLPDDTTLVWMRRREVEP